MTCYGSIFPRSVTCHSDTLRAIILLLKRQAGTKKTDRNKIKEFPAHRLQSKRLL